jgi:predicted N-acyltransferase
MHAEIIPAITAIEPEQWNRLKGTEIPFLRHEFLAALETSGCVATGTGWQACHVALFDDRKILIGAMPLYAKTNSWGEFVFDFAWANAYDQAGLRYYPKLVSAIPFTPATSSRCLSAPETDQADILKALSKAARQHAEEIRASSIHILFPTPQEAIQFETNGLLLRKDCQFHWQNRDYADFDAFLGELTSVKRKKLRRERRRINDAGIHFRIVQGGELDADAWREIMPLYASSFWRRGREPYLNEQFFVDVSRALPDQVVVFLALLNDEPIATAICFRSADTLYGRYWGSDGRYHSLHFETCYYQGIEYCIANGLARFEPGTQGEHKISRGFVATETWSAHWLSHPQFAAAVNDYVDRERDYIDEYIDAVRAHEPYRQEPD